MTVRVVATGGTIASLADPDTGGVVVTHGTDTVDEAALLCDVTVESDVVVATRVPTGGTGTVYGGTGGGVTLRAMGVIAAGHLPAAKARLLLMLLLANGGDVRAPFEEAVATLAGW